MSKPLKAADGNWSARDSRCNFAMLVMLGANEAVKQPGTPLGTKVYYRLVHQRALRLFLKLGGKIDNYERPKVLTLRTRPEITFYEPDIEAMRELVASYDKENTPAKKGAAFKKIVADIESDGPLDANVLAQRRPLVPEGCCVDCYNSHGPCVDQSCPCHQKENSK